MKYLEPVHIQSEIYQRAYEDFRRKNYYYLLYPAFSIIIHDIVEINFTFHRDGRFWKCHRWASIYLWNSTYVQLIGILIGFSTIYHS